MAGEAQCRPQTPTATSNSSTVCSCNVSIISKMLIVIGIVTALYWWQQNGVFPGIPGKPLAAAETDVESVDDDDSDPDATIEEDGLPVAYLGDLSDTDENIVQLMTGWQEGALGPEDGMKRRGK